MKISMQVTHPSCLVPCLCLVPGGDRIHFIRQQEKTAGKTNKIWRAIQGVHNIWRAISGVQYLACSIWRA